MSQSIRFVSRILVLALLTLGCVAVCSQPAGAQDTYQWDAGVGTGSTIEDGPGTWSVGIPNWHNQTATANDQPWANGNDAVIGGGTGGSHPGGKP